MSTAREIRTVSWPSNLRRSAQLIARAVLRRLIDAPAQRPRPMTDAAAGDLIELDLEDEVVAKRDVRCVRVRPAPAARRIARRVSGEARRTDVRAQTLDQRALLFGREGAAETNVVEQSVVVVDPEQQRADLRRRPLRIAETADDAVRRALALDLDGAVAPAARVGDPEPLRDDAVERSGRVVEPA